MAAVYGQKKNHCLCREFMRKVVNDPNTNITGFDIVTVPGTYYLFLWFNGSHADGGDHYVVAGPSAMRDQMERYEATGHVCWEQYGPGDYHPRPFRKRVKKNADT